MAAGTGGQNGFRLKAKEKILVQLYLHRCEPDEGVFPFEVTQKGLSDHLGLRRSHVAVALQELTKDGFVEVVKGHVEGAERRQNAYCVTSKGADTATTVRERLLDIEVSFEDASGTSTVKISEIVTSRRASLASIINQLDRGGPVRDEIAIMTSPEKKLISVFCPTCKKQIEVDNVFFEEEVGFDCPGCGRPYRIVPALKKEEPLQEGGASHARAQSNATAVIVMAVIVAMAVTFFSVSVCLSTVFMAAAGAGIVVWALLRTQEHRVPRPRTPLSALTWTALLTPVLLLLWHLTVAEVDLPETMTVMAPIWAGLAITYAGVFYFLPEFKGDCLLSSGIVLILVAATTMFLEEFGIVDVGMALVVGISGGAMVILSTFHPIDRDAAVLDGAMSFGAFLLLLTGVVLVRESSETIDFVAAGAVALLGVTLIGLRIAREKTGVKDLSLHLVASIPLTAAACLFVLGLFLLKGGSLIAGAAELAAAAPFAYFGHKQVFSDDWPYRVPLVVVFVAVILIVMAAGLLT